MSVLNRDSLALATVLGIKTEVVQDFFEDGSTPYNEYLRPKELVETLNSSVLRSF